MPYTEANYEDFTTMDSTKIYDNLNESIDYYSSSDENDDNVIETTSSKTISSTFSPISTSENPCEDGLVPDSSGNCRLSCEIDCHYGTYYENTCLCNEGFRNAPNNECVCEPHCEYECRNGLCTGNNTCLCDDGYNLNPEDNFVCLDSNMCHCKNGDCSDPDHCDCWKGYQMEHSETNYHRCEPICGDTSDPQGCVNGKCVAPYLCKCDEGYVNGPDNNYTCYANVECSECLENDWLCLPACYATTELTTELSSDLNATENIIDTLEDILQ